LPGDCNTEILFSSADADNDTLLILSYQINIVNMIMNDKRYMKTRLHIV
jgi:hypothetical protein